MKSIPLISILVNSFPLAYAENSIIPIASGSAIAESNSNIMKQREEQIKIWVNPCTGSISTEEKPADQLPCLKASNMPSISKVPSLEPSISKIPSAAPSKPLPEVPELPIIPPAPSPPAPSPSSPICYKCKDSENTVTVKFKYSVETTSSITDVTNVLPNVEATLLKNLASELLEHCLRDDDNDINLKIGAAPPIGKGGKGGKGDRRSLGGKKYKRRNLNVRRRLGENTIVGICSTPTDKLVPSGMYIFSCNND